MKKYLLFTFLFSMLSGLTTEFFPQSGFKFVQIISKTFSSTAYASDDSSDDDFAQNPFEDYNESLDDSDQEQSEKFFHYGRFYGIGMGVGYAGHLQNRAQLYQPSFPSFEVKMVIFFDFNFALQVDYQYSQHKMAAFVGNNVNSRIGGFSGNFKYYFNTSNLSAALTLANPYILGGVGSYKETRQIDTQEEAISQLGLNAAFGMEFPIIQKKFYLGLEGRYKQVFWEDRNSTQYIAQQLPDLNGGLYNLGASILVFW